MAARVGIDVKTLTVHGAGIATFLRAVLPALLERARALEFVVLGPAGACAQAPAAVERHCIELADWAGKARLPLYDQWQLRRAARRAAIDLLYSPYFDAPVATSVPVVVTMHDAVHFRFPALYPRIQRGYYRGLMRHHARHARLIVTDSEFSKRELVDVLDLDPPRVRVVPLALPPSFRARDEAGEAVLGRYGLRPGYVLYTGGVEPRKNLARLLEAYEAWASRRDVPPLVLTGPAARYDSHLASVSPAAQDRVVRPGRVDEKDMWHVYEAAVAVVYPSLYEGFGFPVLEAMTVGVPVACADRGSLPEIGGPAARYFDPEDVESIAEALEVVVSDAELRARMIRAGRDRAAAFTIGATADGLLSVFTAALGHQ